MQKKPLNAKQPGKIIYLTVFLVMLSSFIFAQQIITVKGKVTSDDQPLAGATVSSKNEAKGTKTNAQGLFTLQVNKGDSLIVSFVGYESKHIVADNTKVLSISLSSNTASSLSDVVVVGYGTQNKRDLATSTSTVSSADFKSAIITTVDQALQGRAAGVQVVQTSGEPGAQSVVRIRGNNSLSGDNQPLYVIDGFPMSRYQEASTTGVSGSYTFNGLYGINPNDIAEMVVLKDAAATAIYGSRGANGVVLITTKTGKSGKGRIGLVNKYSLGTNAKTIKMLTGQQYADVVNQTYKLVGNPQPFNNPDSALSNTNWFNAVSRQGLREDLALNASGGGPKSTYYVSGSYLKDIGTLIGSDNSSASIRANLSGEVNSWYTIKGQFSLVHQVANRGVSSGQRWPNAGGFMDDLRQPPTIPLNYLGYNLFGVPGAIGTWFGNPVIEANSRIDILKNDFSIINIENLFTISNTLKFTVNIGSNQSLSRRQLFLNANTMEGNPNGVGSNTMANTTSYNANAYLTYNNLFNDIHRLNLTLGAEYNTQTLEQLGTGSSGFAIPFFGINNIGSAQIQQISSYREDRKLQSAFFRGNYAFKGKYVLNGSVRVDGASPFSENKKYGIFPVVGAAWNLDEEGFMKNVNFISSSKIRASYGQTGSQAIAPYSSLQAFNNAIYGLGASNTAANVGNLILAPSNLGNPNLSWEKTNQLDIGADFSTLNHRLSFSVDVYNKLTNNLLQPQTLPSQSGYASITSNYGTMSNKGIEFTVLADIINKKDVQFSTQFNISHNKTVLVNLGSIKTPSYASISGNLQQGVATILTPGQPIGSFFGYKVIGLAQTKDFSAGVPNYLYPGPASLQYPGTYKYQDANNDGKIDANDRQILGNFQPDFTFGWTNNFTWKNLSANLFVTGSVGNDALDISQWYLNNGIANYSGVVFNQTQDWYNHRWTPGNPTNDPRYPGVQANTVAVGGMLSPMVEKASYVRLKSFTLSYSFPELKVVKNLTISVTGTNLITITKYRGFDPEVSSYNQTLLLQGIDYGAYPFERTYSFGLSCNF